MTRFRFVTPHRRGKWYPDLKLAQRFAAAIGAGFLDQRTGDFVLYRNARLETTSESSPPGDLSSTVRITAKSRAGSRGRAI